MDKKLQQIKAAGKDKLHIIADFDRTLTKAFNKEGERVQSTYSLISKGKYLTPDYPKKYLALFDHYYPYEISQEITEEERHQKMNEWWHSHFQLMIESGLTKAVLKDIVLKGEVQTRIGFRELLTNLNKHNIPLLIFSAGMGDLIKEFLESENLLFPNTHIISNFYKFDNQGLAIKPKNKNFIHPFNKNEIELQNTPYYNEIKNRPNVILLGDSLGDTKMADGLQHNTIFKIGFLNHKKEELLKTYKQEFDLIITDDGPLTEVIKLLASVLGS